MKLYEISTVISGYTFRGAVKSDPAGNIFVFQAKDLIQGELFEGVNTLTKISGDMPGYSGYLQKNDILLIARGMKSGAFRSTVFMSDAPNVIASSSVHIIRITAGNVLPEYISHYLNFKEGQDSLSQIVSGSYIGALPRKKLEEIEIAIPPRDKQAAITNLFQNMRAQQKIFTRKNEINQSIINAAFKNITTK